MNRVGQPPHSNPVSALETGFFCLGAPFRENPISKVETGLVGDVYMPYRAMQFRAGEYYHVYNRGNNKQPIFFERENYLFFLRRWREYLLRVLEVVAYCLMPNHYHFLVFLQQDDFSRPMQAFGLAYTKAVNQVYKRVGSLFQGRFRTVQVTGDAYLLHLSRYIHMNPVVAGLAAKPEDWEFSSYREYVGLRDGSLPRPQIVISQIGSSDAYRRFVESYRDSKDLDISHLVLD
jgi:REP element-mobilizing transposase RayT